MTLDISLNLSAKEAVNIILQVSIKYSTDVCETYFVWSPSTDLHDAK